jgi:hypothetical protein
VVSVFIHKACQAEAEAVDQEVDQEQTRKTDIEEIESAAALQSHERNGASGHVALSVLLLCLSACLSCAHITLSETVCLFAVAFWSLPGTTPLHQSLLGAPCSQCEGEVVAGSTGGVCRGCFQTKYCSVECQRAHWRAGHKQECKKVGGRTLWLTMGTMGDC